MKKTSYILIIVFFLFCFQLYCQANPFSGRREKGAVFKYDRKDFNELFFYVYERNPLTYLSYFNINSKMTVSIDSIGNLSDVTFKKFVFESSYTEDNQYERTIYNKGKIFAAVKAELRRTMYATNGLWLPKLIDGKPISSIVEIEMNFKSSDLFKTIENPDASTYFNIIKENDISLTEQMLKKWEEKCKLYTDSISTSKGLWAIETSNYSNRNNLQKASNYLNGKKYDIAKVYFTELDRRFPEIESIKKLLKECNY